jgi:hypothetical protein
MANVNFPHGFRPLMRSITGGPGAACLPAHKIVGAGTALFIGDAVDLGGSGTKNNASIIAASAGSDIYGVNLNYGAVSTATDHIIVPGQFQLFEVQIDTLTIAQLQFNAALVATAGDAATKLSKHSLGSVATTNTLEVKILKLYESVDNVAGAYARVIVTLNQSRLQDQVAGV